MYRSQYPDAPNLFSNVRRPYRPSISTVFRRGWLTHVIGFFMVIIGSGLLVWNERRTVMMTKALDEGHRSILVPETTSVVFDENNGKLILLSGELRIDESLKEPMYDLSIKAVKLKKRVQMYQWYETADKNEVSGAVHDGDHDSHHETSYSYAKDWFDKRVNSESFANPMGHHNTEYWPHNSTVKTNDRVKIGGFLLGKELKAKFEEFTQFTSDERPSDPGIKMHAGLYFHANDVWESEVGDIRVQFSYAGRDGEQVTVVGKQSGNEIKPYLTEDGSTELLFLHYGLRGPNEIFHTEHAQNKMQTWIYRMAGWFISFLGLNCLSSLLDIVVDDYPYARGVLVLGVTSLPFSFSISLSLLFISIGWVLYRPLIGLVLLLISLAPITVAAYKIHNRRRIENRHRL